MDYTNVGYNDFLLRPLEATYTEQAGIDSSNAFERISGSQISGDKIFSLNKNLVLDLEGNVFTVSEGNIERLRMGKLDTSIGMVLNNNEGKNLLRIDENGLLINDGKLFLNNSNQIEEYGSDGFHFDKILQQGSVEYADEITADGNEVSTVWYNIFQLSPITLTIKKRSIGFFTVNTHVELYYRSTLRLSLFINGNQIFPGAVGQIYKNTDDNEQHHIPLTFTHMQIFEPGTYTIVLKKNTTAGNPARTGWAMYRPIISYIIF